MGDTATNNNVDSDDSVVDPATGLTLRQKNLIMDSWEIIGSRQMQKKNGVNFFLELFKAYPDQQEFFPLFRDKSQEELATSSKMRAHATTVMYQIGSFVGNLDDPECLVALVEKVARNHLNRGITIKEFEELRIMFSPFLKKYLGDEATPALLEAWDKLLAVMNTIVGGVAKEQGLLNNTT
ncbi:globin-like [Haliotis cracherodii]|uniref:globin-like n=1 Tax=Haliotis cracherodii TaxID=6455 RepID=UPI0039EB84B6